jgi:hypothetical protein
MICQQNLFGVAMNKYVVYSDMTEDGGCKVVRLTVDEATDIQKRNAYEYHKFIYETDQQALDDFVNCNWGWIEEQDD